MSIDGTFWYIPDAGYFGKDRFEYSIFDPIDTSSAWVYLVVAKELPTVTLTPTGPAIISSAKPLPAGDSGVLAGGVRAADGVVTYSTTDLASDAFGETWGVTRSWTNDSGAAAPSAAFGTNWTVAQNAFLTANADQSTVAVVLNGAYNLTFAKNVGGTYDLLGPSGETLTHDGGTHRYALTDTTGRTLTFHDFDTTLPAIQRGQLDGIVNANGVVTEYAYDGSHAGHLLEATRHQGSTRERLVYDYAGSGVNANRVTAVTLAGSTDAGTTWATKGSVAYDYYDTGDAHGTPGDLRTATTKDASGTAFNTEYYRSYDFGEAKGYAGALKYVVSGPAYERLAASGSPESMTDGEIGDYADVAYEYEDDDADPDFGKATLLRQSGEGCGCNGGQGVFAYSYSSNSSYSSSLDNFNQWAHKTVQTFADASVRTVFTNAYGQTLLASLQASSSSSQTWIDYYHFGTHGELLSHANPSAVTGYSTAYYDLVHFVSGNAQYLADGAGLIEDFSYAVGTTAGDSSAGDVDGYLESTALRHGELGDEVKQSDFVYQARSGTLLQSSGSGSGSGGITTFWMAGTTNYADVTGTDGRTTGVESTPAYGRQRVVSTTLALPTVTTDHHGSNDVETVQTVYNTFGRPVWVKDAAGAISYAEYDALTGAVVKAIADVDTSLTGSFTGLPSGWSTVSTGRHLVSTFRVDAVGRTTKGVDPLGNTTYTVYNDAAHEVRVYAGWDAVAHTTTGPVTVVRDNRALGYTETLTMATTPSLDGSNEPTGAEAVSDIQSLSRSYRNAAGQVVRTDDYVSLAGMTYGAAEYVGTQGTNYLTTLFAYGKQGQLNKTVGPDGTITRVESNFLGEKTSTWVGTDDTPTTGYWSPSNPTGTNMVKVSESQYDGGGVGDSNVTRQTVYTHSSSPDLVTESAYDWRDRVAATKGGVETTEAGDVNRPLTLYDYDNLNQVLRTRTYDGDGLDVAAPDLGGWAIAVGGSLIEEVTAMTSDAAGNVILAGLFGFYLGTTDFDPGPGVVSLSIADGQYFVAEYSPSGALLWVRPTYGAITALAVDNDGGVYAGGYYVYQTTVGGVTLTSPGFLNPSAFVWKLDAETGSTDWVTETGGTSRKAQLNALAADGDGGLYAAGYIDDATEFGSTTLTPAGTRDAFVWKLDAATGSTNWAVKGGGSGASAPAAGVAVDGTGGVYVTGSLDAAASFGGTTLSPAGTKDAYVWALDAATGSTDWAVKGGGSGATTLGAGVTADGSGGVYATGQFTGAGASFGGTALSLTGNASAFVWKLDAATGSTDWVEGTTGYGSALARAVSVDGAGAVYAVGSFGNDATFGGTTLYATSPDNAFVWNLDAATGATQHLDQAGDGYTFGVAGSAAGGVYAAGRFEGTAAFGGSTFTVAGNSDAFLWRLGDSALRSQTEYFYDERGRTYKTDDYRIDQTTGAIDVGPDGTDYWYDPRGLLVKSEAPNGLVTKMAYDGLGQLIASYTTDGGGDSGYADALTVTGDAVWSQSEYAYDDAGQLTLTVRRDRNDGVTDTGALTSSNARTTYAASYYDALGRTFAVSVR